MTKVDRLTEKLYQLYAVRKSGVQHREPRRRRDFPRYPSVSTHHPAMRKLKGLSPTGGQLSRTCELNKSCPDVYVGFSYSAAYGKTPYLLCTNPRHYVLVKKQPGKKLSPRDRNEFIRRLDRLGRVADNPDVRFALDLHYEITALKEQIALLKERV